MAGQKSKGFVFSVAEMKAIKKKMIDLDLTQTIIAEEMGVTTNAITSIINRRFSSLRIRNYLSKRLDMPELKIVPDYCL